jgi:hypothetical protein
MPIFGVHNNIQSNFVYNKDIPYTICHIWRILIVYGMNFYANYEDSLYVIMWRIKYKFPYKLSVRHCGLLRVRSRDRLARALCSLKLKFRFSKVESFRSCNCKQRSQGRYVDNNKNGDRRGITTSTPKATRPLVRILDLIANATFLARFRRIEPRKRYRS